MSDTLRRAIAGLAAFAAPFIAALLKSKLGIEVDDAKVVAAVVACLGYLAQSVANTIHARAVAAALPATPAAAVADLAKGAQP